jgi:hypothetical protein
MEGYNSSRKIVVDRPLFDRRILRRQPAFSPFTLTDTRQPERRILCVLVCASSVKNWTEGVSTLLTAAASA